MHLKRRFSKELGESVLMNGNIGPAGNGLAGSLVMGTPWIRRRFLVNSRDPVPF